MVNIDLGKKYPYSEKVDISENDRIGVHVIPKIEGLSSVYFIQLLLENGSTVISRNFHWLSLKEDIFEEKNEWY